MYIYTYIYVSIYLFIFFSLAFLGFARCFCLSAVVWLVSFRPNRNGMCICIYSYAFMSLKSEPPNSIWVCAEQVGLFYGRIWCVFREVWALGTNIINVWHPNPHLRNRQCSRVWVLGTSIHSNTRSMGCICAVRLCVITRACVHTSN